MKSWLRRALRLRTVLVMALVVVGLWALGTCASVLFIRTQEPAHRHFQVTNGPQVVRVTDSLAWIAYVEQRERAGCLLGQELFDSTQGIRGVDTLLVQVFWETVYDSTRSYKSIWIWCPKGLTVGTWHAHPPPMPPAPGTQDSTAWREMCEPSRVDSISMQHWARINVRLHYITVIPPIRCAYWVRPTGELVHLRWAVP